MIALVLALHLMMPNPQSGSSDRPVRDTLMNRVVAAERARVDSLRAVARRAGGNQKPRSSPLEGDPPLFGYAWAFYASLVSGAGIGWLFARLRASRSGFPLGTAAGILWSMVGVIVGAIGFAMLMVANGILSVGFSPIPPWLLFCCSVGAEIFVLASLMQTRFRRRFRP